VVVHEPEAASRHGCERVRDCVSGFGHAVHWWRVAGVYALSTQLALSEGCLICGPPF
jgi:hypothetical protein